MLLLFGGVWLRLEFCPFVVYFIVDFFCFGLIGWFASLWLWFDLRW